MTIDHTKPTDWRGTPIEVGATVVYGASVGRSVALVEAVVDSFTPTGRVWLKVVRRSYGGGWSEQASRVHVGPDRLTVVTKLPPTDVPTDHQRSIERIQQVISRHQELIAKLEAGEPPEFDWSTVEYHTEQIEKLARRIADAG